MPKFVLLSPFGSDSYRKALSAMSILTLLLISVGVSSDAFAVALGKGLQMRRIQPADAVVLAVTFGLFQAAMPLLGWLLGSSLRDYVAKVDHWIAFILLAAIGMKMIWDALRPGADDTSTVEGIRVRELLMLGLATSIDALAVGVSFAFLEVNIVVAVSAIGATTFLLSLAGVLIGHRAGVRFRRPAEVVGGAILILIGIRILLDHLGIV